MVDGSTLHNGVKVIMDLNFGKGGFISESFHFGSNLTNKVPNHYPDHLLLNMWIVLRIVIWQLFLGDWSQSETLSEIKSPLNTYLYN